VRWREAGGAKSKSFPTKEQAKEHLAHIEGTHSPTGALTLKAWAEVWQANRVNLRASTKAKNASLMATHVLPVLGDRQLSSIGQTDVQSLVTNCAGSPATVREVYGQLSKCLSAAVSARLLRVSPCVGIILPKVEQSEMAFLDHDDVERLAKAIDKRYRALVFVLAYCGLRIGEAAALRPEDVTESLGVRTTLVEVSGVLMENSPTTKQGIRSVPMPAEELSRPVDRRVMRLAACLLIRGRVVRRVCPSRSVLRLGRAGPGGVRSRHASGPVLTR
jgi:integrase